MQEHGLTVPSLETFAITNTGASLARADPGWVKLSGMAAVLIEKKILAAEEAEEYQRRYKDAVAQQNVLSLGFIMLQVAQKPV